MSLINDMLRDLDKRKSAYPQQQGDDGVRVTPARNSRNKQLARRWVWAIVLVGLIFLAAFAWHLYGKLQPRSLSSVDQLISTPPTVDDRLEKATAANIVVKSKSAPVSDLTPKMPEFTDILGVTVQPTEGGARISVVLSGPVQHRVFRNAQQLVIDLPATRLTEPLPNLTRHGLIRAVDVSAHATGMQLTFDMAEPVALQTSLLTKQQVHLVIELTAMESALDRQSDNRQQSATILNKPEQASREQLDKEAETASAGFEKTSRRLTLAERDQRANRQALQLMRRGHTQQAEQLLSPLLNDYPLAQQSRATLIALKLSKGQLDHAQQLIAQGLQLTPKQLAFIKLKARLLLAQQLPAEAATLLGQQLTNEQTAAADDQELFALLATASQRAGQHQRAVEVYQQLLALDNQQAPWWVGLAISQEALKQPGAALSAYRRARGVVGISPALLRYAESRITQLQ